MEMEADWGDGKSDSGKAEDSFARTRTIVREEERGTLVKRWGKKEKVSGRYAV